jgi:NAD(P)-dependent dehydrogenase (short-subunit alcohol dehydrogenase family)
MTRTALVTGAMGGLGRAILARLTADGHRVVTLDVAGDCDIVADLRQDVPQLDGIEIDICISNAAVVDTIAPAHAMTGEQWARDIDVNLTGAFRAVQACLPSMRNRGWGRIIVVASAAAQLGLPGQVAYTAAKAGLLGMVKTLAVEGVGHGITANAVLPGLIATPKVLGMPELILERAIAALPMRRLAEPDEVASLVSYLASEDAAYITGQDIRVDGGLGLQHATLGGTR